MKVVDTIVKLLGTTGKAVRDLWEGCWHHWEGCWHHCEGCGHHCEGCGHHCEGLWHNCEDCRNHCEGRYQCESCGTIVKVVRHCEGLSQPVTISQPTTTNHNQSQPTTQPTTANMEKWWRRNIQERERERKREERKKRNK